MQRLYRHPPRCQAIQEGLAGHQIVRSVTANPVIATVLVRFDASTERQELEQALAVVLAQQGVPVAALAEGAEVPVEPQRPGPQRPAPAARAAPEPAAPTLEAHQGEPWHAMTGAEVAERLGTALEAGLAPEEARERVRTYGHNLLVQPAGRPDLAIFLKQFLPLPVGLPGISAAISLLTGGLIDAAAIATLSQPLRRHAAVVRGGEEGEIPTEALVPGDLLLLSPGAYVAADARLVKAHRLTLANRRSPSRRLAERVAISQIPPIVYVARPDPQAGRVDDGTDTFLASLGDRNRCLSPATDLFSQ